MKNYEKALRLGLPIYYVDRRNMYEIKNVKESEINGISKDDGGIWISLPDRRYTLSIKEIGRSLFLSKIKAENVVKNDNEALKRTLAAFERKQAIYEQNKQRIDEFAGLVGKEVLVNAKGGEKRVSSIREIIAMANPNEFGFIDKALSNLFLFRKEGKNWFYRTPLVQARIKKESLDKQMQELKHQIKKVTAEIKLLEKKRSE